MVPPVNLLAVATAVPPHKLGQRAVADAARQVYGRTFARFPKLATESNPAARLAAGLDRLSLRVRLGPRPAPYGFGEVETGK